MAVFARGWGVVAVVTGDLDKALLGRSGGEAAGDAEEALAGELEDGIILRGGPFGIAGGDAGLHVWIITSGCTGVEPRENDVDSEVRAARGTEQRTGFGLARASEGPVMFPKNFWLYGKHFVEGGDEFRFRGIDL